MKQKIIALSLFALLLTACGQVPNTTEEACNSEKCSETDINAPVPGVPTPPSSGQANPKQDYRMPDFDSSWGLSRAIYEKTVKFYERNYRDIPNKAYVTIIDFGRSSSNKRFYLFNLANGTVEKYLTSHGAGSDPDNDGMATLFSNIPNSKQSSLGFYLTLSTYMGSHGYSLRLNGLESSNSNAESRAIVMHPADYVSEKNSRAGRSWGCPALDPSISKSVIDRVRDGSLILIDK